MTSTVSFLTLTSDKLSPVGGMPPPAHPGAHMTVALILAWPVLAVPVALVIGKAIHNADVRELELVS